MPEQISVDSYPDGWEIRPMSNGALLILEKSTGYLIRSEFNHTGAGHQDVLGRLVRAMLEGGSEQAGRPQGGQGAEQAGIDWREQNAERVVRAFWRRIYPYRNQFDKELPEDCPVEFLASMATALSAITHAKPAQQGSVPEGIIQKLRNIEFSVRHEIDKTKESRWRVQDRINEVINLLSTKTTPQPEGDWWKVGVDYSVAFIKRKQAEEVEAFGDHTSRVTGNRGYQLRARGYAKNLRDQAADLEADNAGGTDD